MLCADLASLALGACKIPYIYPSVLQAPPGRGYARRLEGCF